jgi:hypothetical protein
MLMNFPGAQMLSKEEQKDLKGGYGVTCTTEPGHHQESPGSCTNASRAACQKAVDKWCDGAEGCAHCYVN